MSSAAFNFAAASIQPLTSPGRRHSSQASSSSPSSSSKTTANPPSSPSLSLSGSELSYTSDTETESNATDYITTPPTSPQRAQQIFQQMMSSPPVLTQTASKTSPVALGSMLASVKLAPESSPSTLTPTMSITPTPASPGLFATRASKARPPFVQSLSSKRPRQVPGTLDLSSLPQFPQHPPLHLTPQGSELSGSTPRAVAERPGLFSRWSTDSESVSSCTSSDCESAADETEEESNDSERHDAADEADAENGGEENEGRAAKRPTAGQRSITMKRSISGPNPFFLSPSISLDPIPSPLPVSSPHGVSSLLPPAPKPHQHGFSPYAEEQGFSFAGPSSSVSSPLARLSPSSPSALNGRRKRSHRHKHKNSKQGESDDGFHNTSSSLRDASPSVDASNTAATQTRLTRSQGLRIKDQGDKPRGRYARALSQQLRHGVDGSSSPIKTATALLGGTISPAESTTDPLRVKLREMPGAKTPDGLGPTSPSPSSRQSHYHPHSQYLRPAVARSMSSPKLHASSPLHLSSYPGESSSSAKDTKLNVFNSAFSFAANRESPARSPLALKSPRSPMGTIRENEQDSNPYFAGYA